MAPMGDHSQHAAAGAPLRRAHFAAWSVFLGMAGTSMAFQTYHSLHYGKMPWGLAYLYGIVPLAISVGVLAFAAHWASRWARGGAYAVTAGAMYLAASATGKVSQHAAPDHASLLFGLLMDGAALLAIHFIFSGPTAAQAVAAVTAREAELLAAAEAERSAREAAQAAHRAAEDTLRAEAEAAAAEYGKALAGAESARTEAERAAREAAEREAAMRPELEAQRDEAQAAAAAERAAREADREAHVAALRAAREATEAERAARETAGQEAERRRAAETERNEAVAAAQAAQAAAEAAETARSEAQREAAAEAAKAEALTRKLAKSAGAKDRKTAPGESRRTREPAVPKDFDAQAEALSIVLEEPGISGAELARRVGMSERWGQDYKKNLAARGADGAEAAE